MECHIKLLFPIFPFAFQLVQLLAKQVVLPQSTVHHFHGASRKFRRPIPVFFKSFVPFILPLHVVGFHLAETGAVFDFKLSPRQFHLRQSPEERGTHIQIPLREICIAIQFPFAFLPGCKQGGFDGFIPWENVADAYSGQKENDRNKHHTHDFPIFNAFFIFPEANRHITLSTFF